MTTDIVLPLPALTSPGTTGPAAGQTSPARQPGAAQISAGSEPVSAAARQVGRIVPVLTAVTVDVGLSLGLFLAAKAQGAADVTAYLVAGAGPLLTIAVQYLRTRRLGVVPALVLAWTLFGAALSLVGGQDGRTLLLKDSLVTATVGLAMLGSLVLPGVRPMMFHFGLRYGTDGTPAGLQRWYDRYAESARFRSVQRTMTMVWGVGMLLEALVRVGIVESLDYTLAFTLNQVLPLAFIGGLIVWTFRLGRLERQRAHQNP